VEAMVSLLGGALLDYNITGREPEPVGNASPLAAPHNVYRCRGKDSWCAVAVFTEAEWHSFKQALGSPPWAEDAKFGTLAGRLDNREELDARIGAWTKRRTAGEVMSRLQGNGVAAGMVRDARDLAADPHLKARGFFTAVAGKTANAIPIGLSRAPSPVCRAAPSKGRDNDYVYGELLGMGEEEMKKLRGNGVI
jgi:benzylsuccinate CoA-transferase BbsF subunit